MWICPKCSRENGNSFNSCKGCGYVISEDEKIIAINNTKKQLADYSSKHTAYKNTYGHTSYTGPKLEYDEDDSYLENYYSDDMFDDDEYHENKKWKVFKPVLIIILIICILGGGVMFLDKEGIIHVFSDTNYKYSSVDGGVEITGTKSSDATIEIPDTINGKSVVSIADMAFAESDIKSVTLPSTLKRIGERAFFNCKSLHYIKLQDGITEIGDKAFASCNKLSDIFIPETVTSIGEDIMKDSNNSYIQGVPGSQSMVYATENDINFTSTNKKGEALNVTPVRVNDEETYTTSKAGYGAGYLFSFVPYESAKYTITVEASIDGYLKINDFSTMENAQTDESSSGKNHTTTLTADLKKEKKYYFGIENEGSEQNKNIEFSISIELYNDERSKAESVAKKFLDKNYTFTAYTDLFYDQHSKSGSSHYLEWNTNVQKVVDYYVEDSGAIWLAIKVPEGYNTTSYDEYGNVVKPATNWWHKLEE